MVIAVTGGAGSGKSAFAESLVERLPGRRIYLATMRKSPGEGERRILRHRAERKGKGFETIEKARKVQEIAGEKLQGAVVLLEDLSNLLANALFPEAGEETLADPLLEVSAGIRHLCENAGCLILVMNEVFSDGFFYGEETENYRRALAELSREVAERADLFIEVVFGIPLPLKGDLRVLGMEEIKRGK